MRTTVSIDDELLSAARLQAQSTGTTLGSVLEAALRRELATRASRSEARPSVPVFDGGTGPRPGVDLTSNAALQEVLDEGLPVTERR